MPRDDANVLYWSSDNVLFTYDGAGANWRLLKWISLGGSGVVSRWSYAIEHVGYPWQAKIDAAATGYEPGGCRAALTMMWRGPRGRSSARHAWPSTQSTSDDPDSTKQVRRPRGLLAGLSMWTVLFYTVLVSLPFEIRWRSTILGTRWHAAVRIATGAWSSRYCQVDELKRSEGAMVGNDARYVTMRAEQAPFPDRERLGVHRAFSVGIAVIGARPEQIRHLGVEGGETLQLACRLSRS